MNYFVISSFFTAGSSIILGAFVLSQKPKDKANLVWFLTTVAVFINWFSLGMIGVSGDGGQALFWQRILYIGTILIPVFFFHFCVIVLKKDEGKIKDLLKGGYVLSVLFIILSFTNLFIVKVADRTFFGYWPVQTGSLYFVFLAYFLFYVAYPIILLKISEKRTSGVYQKQIEYIYYAALIGFVGGATNFLLDFNLSIYPIGNFFVTFYVVFITYAILKHHLFSPKIIVTEMLTFSIWIFLLMRVLLADTVKDQLIDGGLLILLIISGILLIKSVIREVRQREEIEALANRLKSVNSILGHDVKAVLGKNLGLFSEMKEGTFGLISEGLSSMIQRLSNDTGKVLAMIMTILESGHEIKLNVTEFDFKTTVLEVISNLSPDTKEKGLTVNSIIDETQDYKILADQNQLTVHVIQNLIENAINYTPKGFIEVRLTKSSPMSILLAVKDSGVGITNEDKLKLFKEGGHGTDSIKVNVHSTGYGLFIAKKIVDSHGGKIWAESEGKDKGSTFFVELPVKGLSVIKTSSSETNKLL